MRKSISQQIVVFFTTISLSFTVFAGWELSNSDSSVHFISVKKSQVGEIHSFKSMNGQISDTGKVKLQIALSSVETLIPIRNERMKSMLFEVSKYASASVTAEIDVKKLTNLKPGEFLLSELSLDINLHGASKRVVANLRATMLANGKLSVSTTRPFILNASDFALIEGIEKLRKVANLPSISSAVPVTVDLIFNKQ